MALKVGTFPLEGQNFVPNANIGTKAKKDTIYKYNEKHTRKQTLVKEIGMVILMAEVHLNKSINILLNTIHRENS